MNKKKLKKNCGSCKASPQLFKNIYEKTACTKSSGQTRNVLEHFEQFSAIPMKALLSNDTIIQTLMKKLDLPISDRNF